MNVRLRSRKNTKSRLLHLYRCKRAYKATQSRGRSVFEASLYRVCIGS